jgi:hypothetical protein
MGNGEWGYPRNNQSEQRIQISICVAQASLQHSENLNNFGSLCFKRPQLLEVDKKNYGIGLGTGGNQGLSNNVTFRPYTR